MCSSHQYTMFNQPKESVNYADTRVARMKDCVFSQTTKRQYEECCYNKSYKERMCVSLWNKYPLFMFCYFLLWVVYFVSLKLMLEYVTMCDKSSHSQAMLNVFKMELLGVRSFLASCLQILDAITRLWTSLHYFYWNSYPLGL